MVVESLKYNYVREFLQKLLTQDRYKKITPPESLIEGYQIGDRIAFFLGLDGILKYDQIIGEEKYLNTYVEQLERIFKKLQNGEDIRIGIYQELGKIVSKKLNVDIDNHNEIIRYIYNKYIINGYFYFGCSSNYMNEIDCIGIRKASFKFDDRLLEINKTINKISNKTLFYNDRVTLTDDITVSLYYAFLSPNYISNLIGNSMISNKKNDLECFYRKDIAKIKELLLKTLNYLTINNMDKITIINNFIDVYMENINSKPCIARIKRSCFNKDSLKDIENILINRDDNLGELIALILESRYSSLNIVEDIMPENIETIILPTYNEFLVGKNNFTLLPSEIKIDKEDLEINNSIVSNNMKVNSYGSVSFAIIGILLIIIGVLLSILLKIS